MAADQATPSQRVVGSSPTRRTNFRRPQPCPTTAGTLSPDQTTGLVSANLERAVPRSLVVIGDGAAGLEQELQPPADGACTRRCKAYAMTATRSYLWLADRGASPTAARRT